MKKTLTMYGAGGMRSGEPVGFVFTMGDSPWGEPVILTKIFVLEKYRNQGHGKALMAAILKQADREHKDVVLVVAPDPDTDFRRLVDFCESFGFKMLSDGLTMRRRWVELLHVPNPYAEAYI